MNETYDNKSIYPGLTALCKIDGVNWRITVETYLRKLGTDGIWYLQYFKRHGIAPLEDTREKDAVLLDNINILHQEVFFARVLGIVSGDIIDFKSNKPVFDKDPEQLSEKDWLLKYNPMLSR